jgi:hypothetical protein
VGSKEEHTRETEDSTAKEEQSGDGESSSTSRLRGVFTGVTGTAALIGAIITIIGATGWAVSKFVEATEDEAATESNRLEDLQAGITFDRFTEVLEQEPDVQQPVGEAPDSAFLVEQGANRYVFRREFDYVQAIVDRNNTVIAFSVIARSPDIDPTYEWDVPVTLGKSHLDDLGGSLGGPSRFGGFCGANRAQYFEARGGFGAANHKEFAVGVTQLGFGADESFRALCEARTTLYPCGGDESYVNTLLTGSDIDCFVATPEGQRLRSLPINTYIESAPTVELSSEMLVPVEHEVGLGSP